MNTHQKGVSGYVDVGYRAYLSKLHERNKQKLSLQKKSKETERIERLEQGFSLYFNNMSTREGPSDCSSRRSSLNFSKSPSAISSSRNGNSAKSNSLPRTKSAPIFFKQHWKRRKAWEEVDAPPATSHLGTRKETSGIEALKKLPIGPPLRSTSVSVLSSKTSHCTNSAKVDIWSSDEDNSPEEFDPEDLYPDIPSHLEVHLDIFDNWGNKDYVGFSGLQLIHEGSRSSSFSAIDVSCVSLSSEEQLPLELSIADTSKLINPPFQTTKEAHMWKTPVHHLPIRFCFIFARPTKVFPKPLTKPIFSTNFWNFNDPSELTVGVKGCQLKICYSDTISTIFEGNFAQAKGTDYPKQVQILYFQRSENNSFSPLDDKSVTHLRGPNSYEPIIAEKKWSKDSRKLKSTCRLKSLIQKPLHVPNKTYIERIKSTSTSSLQTAGRQSFKVKERSFADNGLTNNNSMMEALLEESWTSLNFFNHFHSGRLGKPKSSADLRKPPVPKREKIKTAEPDEKDARKNNAPDNLPNSIKLKKVFAKVQPKSNCKNVACVESEKFFIPTLPQGRILLFDIVSTWGDVYYVGLSGIEVFTSNGIDVAPLCEITADPPNINVLPEYDNDPRVVKNLIDGVCWTRDDTHMWLIPFTPGARHVVQLILPPEAHPIAMIRIWNYNKSRVHNSRGAREVIIYLDERVIFQGEINPACGLESGEMEDFSETILFTIDNSILEKVAVNDRMFDTQAFLSKDDCPLTASSFEDPECPVMEAEMEGLGIEPINTNLNNSKPEDANNILNISWIELTIIDIWNTDGDILGLTGVEVLDHDLCPLKVEHITLNGLAICDGDDINCLFDGVNHTIDTEHMWSLPFDRKSPPRIRIFLNTMGCKLCDFIYGLKIWNYNGDNLGKGVKWLRITNNHGRWLVRCEDRNAALIRKGPGHLEYCFAQTLCFRECRSVLPLSPFDSLVTLPSTIPTKGFVFEIDIFSNWQDPYYVGLDGLELLSNQGTSIKIHPSSIFTSPHSEVESDRGTYAKSHFRSMDKLVDGITAGSELVQHCLLVPISTTQLNRIFIVFDELVSTVGLRLWNYSQTPERGVHEFAVKIDDHLVFRGRLPKSEGPRSDKMRYTLKYTEKIKSHRDNQNNKPKEDERTSCSLLLYHTVAFDLESVQKIEGNSEAILDNNISELKLQKREPVEEPNFFNVEAWDCSWKNRPRIFGRDCLHPATRSLRSVTHKR